MKKKTEDVSSSSTLRLFWEFFKIGAFTIGGGPAMIPQIQQIAVEDKKWLDEEEMVDCIALGQSLPGLLAVNLATYIGYRERGLRGALMANLGVVIPAFLAIVLALMFLEYIGDNPYVEGAFTGIKAGVCGLIVVSSVRLGRQILKTPFQWIMMIGCLVAVCFLDLSVVIVILGGIVIGIIYTSVSAIIKKKR